MKDEELEIDILELIKIVFSKIGYIIFAVVVGLVLALIYLQYATPIYESSTSTMVRAIEEQNDMASLLTGSMSSNSNIDTEIEILQSDLTIMTALAALDLDNYVTDDGEKFSTLEFTAKGITDNLTVSPVKNTKILNLTFKNQSKEFACDYLNALVATFDSILENISKRSTQSSLVFIEKQIELNNENLDRATDALAQFQIDNNTVHTNIENQKALVSYGYILTRLAPLDIEIQESRIVLDDLGLLDEYISLINDDFIVELSSSLKSKVQEALYYELLSVQSGMQSDIKLNDRQKDRYFGLNSTIDEGYKTISSFVATNLGEYSSSVNLMTQLYFNEIEREILNNELLSLKEIFDAMPELEKDIELLKADITVYQTMAITLLKMQQETYIKDSATINNVNTIDVAIMGIDPISPNKLMILAIAVLLSGFLSCAVVVIVHYCDKNIISHTRLQEIIPEGLFLGWIPLYKLDTKVESNILIPREYPASITAEKIKYLTSSLLYKGENFGRVITTCSANYSHGKTTLMCNVAYALTELNLSVLLIDGDLRLPSVGKFFNVPDSSLGLKDIVQKEVPYKDCIVKLIDGPETTLDFLPAGKTKSIPSLVFTNKAFTALMNSVKKDYDIILIDAPPLSYASELLSLAKNATDTLVVVRSGITKEDEIKALLTDLDQNGVPVTGICLNAYLPTTDGGDSYYTSYGNSGYGNEDSFEIDTYVSKRQSVNKAKRMYRRIYRQNIKARNKKIATANQIKQHVKANNKQSK